MKPVQLARRPPGLRPLRPPLVCRIRASQRGTPGEAPPLNAPPPPPPPPSGDEHPFPTRRDLALFMIGGSGLWWWKTEEDLAPDIKYMKEDSKANGMTVILAPSGEKYGIKFVNAPNGKRHMVMVDTRGTIYYDPEDRDLGIFVVDPDANLYNAYPSPTLKGSVKLELIGNLSDLKPVKLDGVGSVNLGTEGQVFWGFEDSKPLQINPRALVQRRPNGKFAGFGYPSEVDEGTVTALVKDRNPLRTLFGDKGPGTLQRE